MGNVFSGELNEPGGNTNFVFCRCNSARPKARSGHQISLSRIICPGFRTWYRAHVLAYYKFTEKNLYLDLATTLRRTITLKPEGIYDLTSLAHKPILFPIKLCMLTWKSLLKVFRYDLSPIYGFPRLSGRVMDLALHAFEMVKKRTKLTEWNTAVNSDSGSVPTLYLKIDHSVMPYRLKLYFEFDPPAYSLNLLSKSQILIIEI